MRVQAWTLYPVNSPLLQKACAAGTNKLVIPKMASGTYTVKATAKDKLGNSSQKLGDVHGFFFVQTDG